MLAGCLPGWQTACHVVENFLHNSELLLYLCITIYVILFSYQLLYLGLMVPAGVIQNYSLTVHVGPWNIHVLLSAAFKPQSNPNCWHVQTNFLIENIGVWITIICIIIVLTCREDSRLSWLRDSWQSVNCVCRCHVIWCLSLILNTHSNEST